MFRQYKYIEKNLRIQPKPRPVIDVETWISCLMFINIIASFQIRKDMLYYNHFENIDSKNNMIQNT